MHLRDFITQWIDHVIGQLTRWRPVIIHWLCLVMDLLQYLGSFVTGAIYESERLAFSKQRLRKNDLYRDRLLEPEIVQLVDLWDALDFSIKQRQAFFRCFLHLDYLRRAGIARVELLRYCDLRRTPCADFLLTDQAAFSVEASQQRSQQYRTQRWDIVQFLALCFSLCTLDTSRVSRLLHATQCWPNAV